MTPVDALRVTARGAMTRSAPRTATMHLFETGLGGHVFIVDGSRLFDADPILFSRLDTAQTDWAIDALLAEAGMDEAPAIDDAALSDPPLHALSLAVAQQCNLGCTYCYAQQGAFGGAARDMSQETALQAVDLLVDAAQSGSRLNLAFLGGEPMANRPVVQAATRHAAERAVGRGLDITFSITTNGTLLKPADGAFFEDYGFAVTISLDGPREVHDRLRPYKGGHRSYDRIMENVRPLLAMQRRMQVSARVTVTPANLALRMTLDQLIAEGFHSVGFAPLLNAPSGLGEMQRDDLELMLGAMIDCGWEYERQVQAGARYPFANMVNAMQEIGMGTHRPYPCGAGAGYLGVSAGGELAACHRFVGDPQGALGALATGIDHGRQAAWLHERHVHRQAPCTGCWARYLCGGGCHQEVIRRGRPACDTIRGWLHYCLGAYLRLSTGHGPRSAPGVWAECR
ncbi:MAG TPA: radical SAM protein [Lamprocystis sp. (in: g-proteobacteria)]|nr:radical SAM protein [Lamprocystis sp. (in: g-proteobacteria)]